MKPSRKSNFFTFLFAFCPGAAEMYCGFMKMGVSIFTAFCIAAGLLITIGDDIFAGLMPLIYVYSFFHAVNIRRLSDEDFANYEDKWFWEELFNKKMSIPDKKLKKWGSWALIAIGVIMLYEQGVELLVPFISDDDWEMYYPIIDAVPTVVIAILFVILGVKLIKGKKAELEIDTDNVTTVIENTANRLIESSDK